MSEDQKETPASVGAEEGAGHKSTTMQNLHNAKTDSGQEKNASPSAIVLPFPKIDTHPALAFLGAFHGDGKWNLVAIKPGDIRGTSFSAAPKRDSAALAWIERWNKAGYAIYFNPNPLKHDICSKAPKSEVATAEWLWVDLDPPKGITPEQLEAWRVERLQELNEGKPEGLPPPTWFIDSGRGFWRYWKLKEPAEVDGFGPATQLVESYGKGIELAFGPGADNCRNIDRIARLPGTINHKTGEQAEVIGHWPERQYALEDFPRVEVDEPQEPAQEPVGGAPASKSPASKSPASKSPASKSPASKSPASNEPKFEYDPKFAVEDLPADLRALVKTGCYSDYGNDRSKAVFACAVKLILHGTKLGNITSALLNPEYKISEHVLDQPRRAKQYAVKQVEKAWKWIENDKKHSAGERIGKSAIGMDDFYAIMKTHGYMFLPAMDYWPAASVNSQVPAVAIMVDGRPVTIPATAWLDRHRHAEQTTWFPGEPLIIKNRLIVEGGIIEQEGVSVLNLYIPPRIKLGDATKAGPWIAHLERIYPNDAEHITKWFAHRRQRPGEKINHALVLGGPPGIGKDAITAALRQAVGPYNFQEVSPKQIVERFNKFLKGTVLRVSEMRDQGEVDLFALYEAMKTMLATPPETVRIDEKGLGEYYIPNCVGVIITTNHRANGLYLPEDDRRHYVTWSDCKAGDFTKGYWEEFWAWYEREGYAHVAAYLDSFDLTGFNPKAPPLKTEAFWAIVHANTQSENAPLLDVVERLGSPNALTLKQLITEAKNVVADGGSPVLFDLLSDRKCRRQIPHLLEEVGYVPVRNPYSKEGLWSCSYINPHTRKQVQERVVVYARKTFSLQERIQAARVLVGEKAPEEA